MMVTQSWLKDNLANPDVVILDTRPKIAYSYGHIQNSQSLSIEHVIKLDRYGSHLVLMKKQLLKLSCFGIDDSKTVVVCGENMDPAAFRIAWTLLYFGHQKTFLLDSPISKLQRNGFNFYRKPVNLSKTRFVQK